ncbi:MAG: hypothetical protein K2G77_05490 [Muribaculaceae bacterium]|nr:hypothetical protein [Muribaculaceae bacterium]
MKKHIFLAVGLIMATIGVFQAQAQRDNRHMESGVTTLIHNDKANPDDVEKTMKGNAPKAPNDNGLPRFAIVGKNNDFYLGIGGQFLGEGVFTWGDNMPSATLFTPSALTPAKPGNGGNTQFAWQTSSLYMNFVAMPGSDNQIGIFFKGTFMGDHDTFKLKHLYAKYRGLTVGHTTSLFTDGAAEPMTIDYEGPNGYPFLGLFTAYWEQNFTKHFSGAIGIDAPTASLTYSATTEKINQRIPAIPLYLQYAWNEGASHVRLSGLVRPMQYRNLTGSANKSAVGGGVQVSGMTKVVGDLGVNFNAAYGKGIGTYLQDDNGLGLDAVATSKPGKMETVKTFGVTGGLNYAFSSKVSTNLTYSHLVNWLPEDAVVSDSQYRYGDYVAANVIYNINKFISAGIEYDYGHRKDFNGNGLHANRLQCQLAVTF